MGFHLRSVFHSQALRFITIWDYTLSRVVISTWWFFFEMHCYHSKRTNCDCRPDSCVKPQTHAGGQMRFMFCPFYILALGSLNKIMFSNDSNSTCLPWHIVEPYIYRFSSLQFPFFSSHSSKSSYFSNVLFLTFAFQLPLLIVLCSKS